MNTLQIEIILLDLVYKPAKLITSTQIVITYYPIHLFIVELK